MGVVNSSRGNECAPRFELHGSTTKNVKGGVNEEKNYTFSFDVGYTGNGVVFYGKRRIWG
jgi:hypothetical protein